MRKITAIILSFFIFFSIANNTYANNLSIEKVLDLNYHLEDKKLNLKTINRYQFNSYSKTKMLNDFIYLDWLLRWEVTRLYRNDKLSYNKMNWVVTSYNRFIYHINRYFYYEYLGERSNYKELLTASNRNFELARWYFQKTKNIITR